MTDLGVDTRLVPVGDRQVVVRKLTEAQLGLMGREAGILSDSRAENARKLKAIGRVMDLLEQAVVQEDDREFIVQLNIKGELTMGTLLSFVNVFYEEEKVAVRRGRPRASK
jgi:hypothetical protein